jgi:hypothetical protein
MSNMQEHGDAVCCAALGQSPSNMHSTGAKLQQLLDLKVQQWQQQQQQKGQLQQLAEVCEEDAAGKAGVTAAAAAAGTEVGNGGSSGQLLCDASGQAVEGLQQVADGHLVHRDW